jgi:hypothetical protein
MNVGALEADLKDFLFRMVHSKLYLNQQRAHYADVRTRRCCTFCMIIKEKELKNSGVEAGNEVDKRENGNFDLRILNICFEIVQYNGERNNHTMF